MTAFTFKNDTCLQRCPHRPHIKFSKDNYDSAYVSVYDSAYVYMSASE